jgi:hypothetical protein
MSRYQRALALFDKIGDAKHTCWCALWMGMAYLALGDLQHAAEYSKRGLDTAQSVGSQRDMALSAPTMATVWVCEGDLKRATETFGELARLMQVVPEYVFRDNGWTGAWATLALGRYYLAHGEREEGLRQVKATVTRAERDVIILASALSTLEEDCEDAEEFRAFADRLRGECSQVGDPSFTQWFLEPIEPGAFHLDRVRNELAASLSSAWIWQDPFADCSYTAQDGLIIQAANGRDLWHINRSAPRLLQPISGGFAAQTVCVPASTEKPGIGGMLLWKDQENFLRLDRGTRGQKEISFQGCLGDKDVVLGRGRLLSERTFLRIERLGARVNALCSADGRSWFTVGHVEFPVEDPVEIGLHAIGGIDRTVYPGAYPEGTAIRFESFDLWS